jgi:predicted aspartyl protease
VSVVKKTICRFLYPWLLALSFPYSTTAQQEPRVRSSTTSAEIPFRLYNGFLIVVEGRIGNLNGLKFILDTGTSTSILDRRIADRLSLPRHPNHVVNYDKTVGVDSATIPEVHFGPVQATDKNMLIADLGKFSDFARDVDAVIGVDLLQLNNITFDYNTRRVTFSPIDHMIQDAHMGPTPLSFTVEVQVQGHRVCLILDTGLNGVLLYEDRIRAHVPELRVEAGVKNVTFGGRMNAKLATLPDMQLGPKAMDGRVLLMKVPPTAKIDDIDGYIGISAFNTTRITFNFDSKTIRWE